MLQLLVLFWGTTFPYPFPRCYISNLFQTEGNGETLAIIYAKEGDEGENKVVWMLEDTVENDE